MGVNDYTYASWPRTGKDAVLKLRRDAKKVIAIDIETTGLSFLRDRIVSVQLYTPGERPVFLDVREMNSSELADCLRPIMEDETCLKVGHNLAFDYLFILQNTGLPIVRLYDTMLAERLLTAGLFEDADLAAISKKYLNVEMDKSLRLLFNELDPTQPIPATMVGYALKDVLVLPSIMNQQIQKLMQQGLIETARLEFEVMPYLIEATRHGVLINSEAWREHVDYLSEQAMSYESMLTDELQTYVDKWRENKFSNELSEYEEKIAGWTVMHAAREAIVAAKEEEFQEKFRPEVEAYELALASWKSAKKSYYSSLSGVGLSVSEKKRLVDAWIVDNPEPRDPKVGARIREIMSQVRRDNPTPTKPPKPVCGSGSIDLSSYQQLSGALTWAGVPLPKKDNGNGLETGRKYLEMLASDEPVVQMLLDWRALEKLVVAFGENIMQLLDDKSRLHPEFNQLVSTGRMSCRKPNVQQVPANILGSKFRECFIAAPGYKLISADYSNIELRVLAEITNESALLAAFDAGRDLHSETAARMFGLKYEEVKEKYPDKRKAAKTIMFGLIYGQGPGGLAMALKISRKEAKSYIESFFKSHPRVNTWLQRTGRDGLLTRYSSTLLGRRRYFPVITSDDKEEVNRLTAAYRRMICNHPIQGTSADITKQAVVNIGKAFVAAGLDAHMVMFIHDEIVVEVREDQAVQTEEIIRNEMIAAAKRFLHRVKVEVGVEVGDHWIH